MKKVINWDNITLEQFIEVQTLEKDNDYSFNLISIVYDISIEEIEDLSIEEFNELLNNLSFFKKLPTKPKSIIKIDDVELHLIDDITKYTLGEWIDIENLLQEDIVGNLPKLCSILYRRLIKGDPFQPDEFEPYGNYIQHRSKLFLNLSIADVYGIVPMMINHKSIITTNYDGLFNNVEEKWIEEDNETPQEKFERRKNERVEKYNQKWGWDRVVHKLADGDITKFDEIYKLPLIMVLNFMSMQSELKLIN